MKSTGNETTQSSWSMSKEKTRIPDSLDKRTAIFCTGTNGLRSSVLVQTSCRSFIGLDKSKHQKPTLNNISIESF